MKFEDKPLSAVPNKDPYGYNDYSKPGGAAVSSIKNPTIYQNEMNPSMNIGNNRQTVQINMNELIEQPRSGGVSINYDYQQANDKSSGITNNNLSVNAPKSGFNSQEQSQNFNSNNKGMSNFNSGQQKISNIPINEDPFARYSNFPTNIPQPQTQTLEAKDNFGFNELEAFPTSYPVFNDTVGFNKQPQPATVNPSGFPKFETKPHKKEFDDKDFDNWDDF